MGNRQKSIKRRYLGSLCHICRKFYNSTVLVDDSMQLCHKCYKIWKAENDKVIAYAKMLDKLPSIRIEEDKDNG